MRRTFRIFSAALLMLSARLIGSEAIGKVGDLCERVEARATYPGALRASEVCMRSLVPRSASATRPHDTLQAIRGFHVTRLEWIYGLTPEFVAKVKALGVTVSGACVNGTLAGIDKKVPNWYMPYTTLDLDGNAIEATWMRPWKGHTLWECINNPLAREACLEYVKGLVDLGITDLQRDGPEMNHSATNWGGCFCGHCVTAFRVYLEAQGDRQRLLEAGVTDLETFDYGAYLRAKGAPVGDAFRQYPQDYLKGMFIDFQEVSTVAFHHWWRKELNAYAGRCVPVSSNNGILHDTPVHRVFDYHIGELNWAQAQPETLWNAARRVRGTGKGQSTTMPLRRDTVETPEWIRRTRQTIATNYALGMHIEAPWDTYLPVVSDRPPRYFGRAEDYADLFALVRACSPLLDSYEEAAVTGGLLADSRGTVPVRLFAAGRRIYAFTRTRPGMPEAPIVTHLIDWTSSPQPFTISLDPAVLFSGRPVAISLIVPKPYEAEAHATAFETRDYAPLVHERVLARGKVTTVSIPALSPWGMLVIRPLPESPGIWAPSVALTQAQGGRTVALGSLSEGATIGFTTDGSPPTSAPGKRYGGPIPMDGLTQIRACAFSPDGKSEESWVRHLPTGEDGPRSLLKNSDFAGGTEHWVPVVAPSFGGADALAFAVEAVPRLAGAVGARLTVRKSDGVPYHLRLTQPVTVREHALLYLTSTLVAARPTRVRLGVQERRPPHRCVMVRVFEIGTEPTRLKMTLDNPQPDLEAQYQLDLGFADPGTTVWLSGVQLREMHAV